jgi:hypothetical protein
LDACFAEAVMASPKATKTRATEKSAALNCTTLAASGSPALNARDERGAAGFVKI